MYVRWERRSRKRPKFDRSRHHVPNEVTVYAHREGDEPQQDVTWVAALLEGFSVNGKPRQRYISYLGSISESALVYLVQRNAFWKEAMEHLDRLASRISSAERKKIEKALSARVSRPTAMKKNKPGIGAQPS
jgi:hypothetical protein